MANYHKFLKYKLLDDPLFFTRYFYKKIHGRKFVIGEHHQIIAEKERQIFKGELTRVIFNLPPRYSKTELIVKNFISQGLALNPKSKYIHTSFSDTLALDNSEAIRHMVRSDPYQEIFPMQIRKDSDSKKKWYTDLGGGIYATASGGQITGFGAGLVDLEQDANEIGSIIKELDEMKEFGGAIVIDDPLKPEDARSKVQRDKVNQRFDNTIRSRVNSRKTPIIIVMQRLHPEDLTGYLTTIEPGIWEVVSLPAIKEDGTALWEFKHTIDELLHLYKINTFVFLTQYQQNTTDIRTGGEIFKNFDMKKHVKPIEYDTFGTISIVVDNNVYPYIAISIWQLKDKKEKQIHEIPAEEPNNQVTRAAKLVVDYLHSLNYEDVVYIYADQTTENRNTIDENKQSFLDKFCSEIRKNFVVSKRIQSKNPPVAISCEFVDAIFGEQFDGIEIEISDSCKKSYEDYNTTKADAEGKILKKKVTDTEKGISYEPNGHFADLIRYKLVVDFPESFRKFAKGEFVDNNYTIGKQLKDRSF